MPAEMYLSDEEEALLDAAWESVSDNADVVKSSPFRKEVMYNKSQGGTCEPGQRADLTGCTPADGHASAQHTTTTNEPSNVHTYTQEQIAEARQQLPEHKRTEMDRLSAEHQVGWIQKKTGKPVHPRIKELLHQAEVVSITEEPITEPTSAVDSRDYDDIEKAMEPGELDEMREYLNEQRQNYVNNFDDSDFESNVDRNDISGNLYNIDDIRAKADELAEAHPETQYILKQVNDWYYNYYQGGERGARKLVDLLRQRKVPESYINDISDYVGQIEKETDEAFAQAEQEARDEFMSNLADNYDDTYDRREYLRQFYDDHSDEPRFTGEMPDEDKDRWGHNRNSYEYYFDTPSGTYNISVSQHKGSIGAYHTLVFSDAGGDFGVTGAGHAHEIFSKVAAASIALVQNADIEILNYTAAEPSRQKLYDRLTKTVLAAMPDYEGVFIPGKPKTYIVAKKEKLDDLKARYGYAGKALQKGFVDIQPGVNESWWTAEGWEEETNGQHSGIPEVKVSPFRNRAKALFGYKDNTGGTCKVGERSDLTGCTPRKRKPGAKKPAPADKEWELRQQRKKPKQTVSEKTDDTPVKRRAERGKLVYARREGKGKDAKVLLHGGKEAPLHIKPAMIPPAWKEVKVSMDPDADILVTAKDAKGKSHIVYSEKYAQSQQAAKFAKINEGLQKFDEIRSENLNNLKATDPAVREAAAVVWLMQEQATRPGSDADTKGLEHLYGQPVSSDNIIVKQPKKKGKPSVAIKIGDQVVPIRDEGTRNEIMRRMETGESLEDSTFWLKSHGATTLEARHVVETDEGIRLQFVGKEGVWHDHLIRNQDLAFMLLERKEKGGKLFDTDYATVSDYSKTLDGGKFTPKDFRTMRATRMALKEIAARPAPSPEEYKDVVMEIATKVSGVLGNRPQQALESYISPTVWAAWRSADLDAPTSEKRFKSLQVKSSPFRARYKDTSAGGYTGKITDKIGRHRCYLRGDPVPCNTPDSSPEPKVNTSGAVQTQYPPRESAAPNTPSKLPGAKPSDAQVLQSGANKPTPQTGGLDLTAVSYAIADKSELTPAPGKAYTPDVAKPNPKTGVPDAARVGVPAMSVPPPPDEIPRLPNLTKKQRKVESRFAEAYLADPDGMARKYLKALKKRKVGEYPNIFATDDVKMLNPDWNPGGIRPGEQLDDETKKAMAQYNTAVHQTANAVTKRAFLMYLDDVVSKLPPDKRTVLVTNGGCAAGKGSSLKKAGKEGSDAIAGMLPAADMVGAVWDAAGEQNATENPWLYEECRKRGIKTMFAYVWAEPEGTWDAEDRGVIRRAMRKGRMVDARLYADSYAQGAKNMKAFVDNYGGKAGVEFIFLDNRNKAEPKALDSFPEETLRWDADGIYKNAVEGLIKRHEELDPALVKGGLAGLNIWGPPSGSAT